MEGMKPQRVWFGTIRKKLIISFCLLFLVVQFAIEYMDLNGIPFTGDSGWQGQVRSEAFGALNLIADMKKDRLLRWLKECRSDIRVLSENKSLASSVVELKSAINKLSVEGGTSDHLRREESYIDIKRYFTNIMVVYGIYDRILAVSGETGKILFSTDEEEVGSFVAHNFHYKRAMTKGMYIDDIEICDHKLIPVLYFSQAIKDKQGEPVAVLVMVVNPDDIIRPILHTGEGLGERGEALLVNKDVSILTSLKHPLSDGTTPKPLEYRIKAEPAVRAARGEEGIIETEDYRGEPVLAAYRYIPVSPQWGWGMVVKRDIAELFDPLRQQVYGTLLIHAFGVVLFIWLTVILARNLTNPIKSLSKTADKVAEGDLDARAPVTSSDEVGVLAATFNTMVQRIKDRTKELQDAQEELVRKEKLATLGQLSGGVGHELRNPLGVISNAVYYLKMVLPDADDKVKEYLEIISSEVVGSEKIISDLLNFSRTKPSHREEVTVSQLVGGVLGKKPPPDIIKVTTDFTPDLPPVFVDPGQMGQVFTNLITNACQAMPEGGDLTIKAGGEDSKVFISVTDTGCGISSEEYGKIFEPLFTTKARGIGLGLSVTKNFVEVNDGSIEAKSEEGKGSTFTVILPTKGA